MFDSLADQIRHDEHEQVTSKERAFRYSLYAVVSVLVFSGLYFAIRAGV